MGATAVAQKLVADLIALDVRATIDPSNIQPPCVVVVPDGFKFRLSGDCADFRYSIYAVAPGVRIADSLPVLDALVEKIAEVIALDDVQAGSIEYGESSLPAYICPVVIDANW
jgi:hypothetical protein